MTPAILFFLNCFQESILAIPQQYFLIPRYENIPILRERAYCYELYHQLRLRLGDNFPYTLHGEIDKRGSAFIEEVFSGHSPNPDFVVHRPGTMDNLIAIEVKHSQCSRQGAIDDLEKLWRLINQVNYRIGIFLVFGPDWNNNITIPDPRILIYWHDKINFPPKIFFQNSK